MVRPRPSKCLLVIMHLLYPLSIASRQCPLGFHGSNCAKQNIAFHQTTYQSSTYEDHKASLVVDGNTNTDIDDGKSCSLTGDHNPSFWSVSLRKPVKIIQITLYLRNKYAQRYSNMVVLVDNVACQKVFVQGTGTQDPTRPNPVNVSCLSPLVGRNVSIHVDSSFFSLCEVQIWDCIDEWFGSDCERPCHCLPGCNVCDKVTGFCTCGRDIGWQGIGCHTECARYSYGNRCSSQCGHCKNSAPCHHITGVCPQGCDAGWKMDTCDEEDAPSKADSLRHAPIEGIVGGSGAAVLVLVLVIVGIWMGIRSKRKRQRRSNQTQLQESVTMSDVTSHSGGPVYEALSHTSDSKNVYGIIENSDCYHKTASHPGIGGTCDTAGDYYNIDTQNTSNIYENITA
ncbi:multiple epidermal growth factor-like domains protein 10 isoform X4 [Haliotis rufescens]|uniref:multiple epidermal growth factor-like domains protein 10 isoform X4 n=1 Tax=Haliotis rufescens TaxID=6454 RepID=UPI00201EF733|nr:multiple epidermal growth factor-like domains protein 10 isoform X4 [Haliotis rufescens]